jgi:hypothetical protein
MLARPMTGNVNAGRPLNGESLPIAVGRIAFSSSNLRRRISLAPGVRASLELHLRPA